MLKRYAIWNKSDPIITPSGAVFTAAQWKDKHPAAKLDTITVVCGAGEINGSYFGTFGQMVQMYTNMGADFSGAATDEEKLEIIEAWEDAQNAPPDPGDPTESTAEERIAAALELANIINLPDENPDDPDE